VVSNAGQHVRASLILNIDILDFFPSIHFGRVKGVFQNFPFRFPENVSSLLAHLCCYNKSLPQGAPTSPILSNLICRGLDNQLQRLAFKLRCRYTRYADDFTISTKSRNLPEQLVTFEAGPDSEPVLGEELKQIVSHHDFKFNPRKIRVQRQSQRLEVTGIIVNSKVNVARHFIRNIRAIRHDWEINGLTAAEKRFQDTDRKSRKTGTPSLREHLAGKLDFLRMVRGGDDELYVRYAHSALRLQPRPNGLPLFGKAAQNVNFLSEAIWILEGRDGSGILVAQGTAFALEGSGFVTARHVLEKSAFPAVSWKLQRAVKPHDNYTVLSYRKNADIDIALLKTSACPIAILRRATQQPTISEDLTVAGFPNWNSPGDKLFCSPTKVVQIKTVSAIQYIIISTHIQDGNSGGPVLNNKGTVSGVVVYGHDSPIAPNGVLAINHIDAIKTSPWKAL